LPIVADAILRRQCNTLCIVLPVLCGATSCFHTLAGGNTRREQGSEWLNRCSTDLRPRRIRELIHQRAAPGGPGRCLMSTIASLKLSIEPSSSRRGCVVGQFLVARAVDCTQLHSQRVRISRRTASATAAAAAASWRTTGHFSLASDHHGTVLSVRSLVPIYIITVKSSVAFNALTLLDGCQEEHPACRR